MFKLSLGLGINQRMQQGALLKQDPIIKCNYISTPDAPANRITGDIDIFLKVKILALETYNAASQFILFGKWRPNPDGSYNNYSWRISLSDGYLSFGYSTVAGYFAGESWGNMRTGITAGTTIDLRIRRIASTGVISFWYNGGAKVDNTKHAGNLNTVTWPVTIGLDGVVTNSKIQVISAKVYAGDSDAGGVLAYEFNPVDYVKATDNVISVSTGEAWELKRNQTNYQPDAVIFDKTKLFFFR